jgi:hypothetical protein
MRVTLIAIFLLMTHTYVAGRTYYICTLEMGNKYIKAIHASYVSVSDECGDKNVMIDIDDQNVKTTPYTLKNGVELIKADWADGITIAYETTTIKVHRSIKNIDIDEHTLYRRYWKNLVMYVDRSMNATKINLKSDKYRVRNERNKVIVHGISGNRIDICARV